MKFFVVIRSPEEPEGTFCSKDLKEPLIWEDCKVKLCLGLNDRVGPLFRSGKTNLTKL